MYADSQVRPRFQKELQSRVNVRMSLRVEYWFNRKRRVVRSVYRVGLEKFARSTLLYKDFYRRKITGCFQS
jgi:hypothetical protein